MATTTLAPRGVGYFVKRTRILDESVDHALGHPDKTGEVRYSKLFSTRGQAQHEADAWNRTGSWKSKVVESRGRYTVDSNPTGLLSAMIAGGVVRVLYSLTFPCTNQDIRDGINKVPSASGRDVRDVAFGIGVPVAYGVANHSVLDGLAFWAGSTVAGVGYALLEFGRYERVLEQEANAAMLLEAER